MTTRFHLGGLHVSLDTNPTILHSLDVLYRRFARLGTYPRLELTCTSFNRLQTELRLVAKITIQVAPFAETQWVVCLDSPEMATPVLESIGCLCSKLEASGPIFDPNVPPERKKPL